MLISNALAHCFLLILAFEEKYSSEITMSTTTSKIITLVLILRLIEVIEQYNEINTIYTLIYHVLFCQLLK